MRAYRDDGTVTVHWTVDATSPTAPSAQLVERALDQLSAGSILAGDKLPSVRALAAEARVNPNTAARAWRELEHLGVARGENGRGVFVTKAGPSIARRLRREATLVALEGALAAALGVGHSRADLALRIGEWLKDSSVAELSRGAQPPPPRAV